VRQKRLRKSHKVSVDLDQGLLGRGEIHLGPSYLDRRKTMLRIASLIYTVASATVMGIFIVIALASGFDTLEYVVIAVVAGAIVALPVSYFIAKAIKEMG
jgi:hypothetical protein